MSVGAASDESAGSSSFLSLLLHRRFSFNIRRSDVPPFLPWTGTRDRNGSTPRHSKPPLKRPCSNKHAKLVSVMAYMTARPSKSLGLSRTSIYSLFSLLALFFLSTLAACGSAASTGDKYLIGVGKADITGPVVEIGFAGYANLDQVGSGLRQRLHSRAFIIADKNNPKDRFVYLVLDTQSGDTATRYGVLEGLKKLGSDYDVYGHNNLALTGTHSHAGPGAWFNYLLPQVTSLGFDKQSYQALVDGAVLSIKRAHENLQEVRGPCFSFTFALTYPTHLHTF